MGKTPCCDKDGVRRGAWTPEEDQALVDHITKHGHGSWRTLPKHAGPCNFFYLLFSYCISSNYFISAFFFSFFLGTFEAREEHGFMINKTPHFFVVVFLHYTSAVYISIKVFTFWILVLRLLLLIVVSKKKKTISFC